MSTGRTAVLRYDEWENPGSPATPPCLVTEEGAACDRQGAYWMTVSDGMHRLSVGACTEHVAEIRALSGTDKVKFTIERITTAHPYWSGGNPETGANDGG